MLGMCVEMQQDFNALRADFNALSEEKLEMLEYLGRLEEERVVKSVWRLREVGTGEQKPIWQDPSKEVAKIFDGTTRTGIPETGAGELDDMTFGGESPPSPIDWTGHGWSNIHVQCPCPMSSPTLGPPTWPPESYRRKRTYVPELGTRGRKTIVAPNAG
ncbi:hypothetical protein C2G38_2205535 [Gigaspora rosea]|uniref:Uncharacterized protein n=1 Tax=Gigaspora rosea TaxID=44941 RepID=A0A397UTZ1_9GLOM|nr:hypothetical protein C2G38_2205535 [Gigaspora rosea]